jgi:uncharacterized glyoxalase superfamily protein PhnB
MTTSEQTTTPDASTPAVPAAAPGLPAPTVWPSVQARDALALIDFYVDTFGFLRTAVYADGDQVAHAQLDWPEGGGIMLGSHKPGAQWSREPGTLGAYVVTDHVDELYARVQRSSATVLREPTEQSYGGREFSVADPEGNLWSFGSYRGEPRS